MKKVTFTAIKPSRDVNFFIWPKEAALRNQEKYWNTGKVNDRTLTYSDDGLVSVSTQIWTDEGWEECKIETDPAILAAQIESKVWNITHGITTTAIVQDV
jgi:hypothetical protein